MFCGLPPPPAMVAFVRSFDGRKTMRNVVGIQILCRNGKSVMANG
jgi:hypothetical protein